MKIAYSTKLTIRVISLFLFVFILSLKNNLQAQNNPEWMYFRSGIVTLADAPVYQIAIDDSLNKWCLIYGSYLCKLKDSTWTTYDSPDYLYSLSIDKDGVKWLGTLNGLMKFDGEKFDTANPEIPLKWVVSVATDKFNNKWLLSDAGLIKYDNLKWTIVDSLVSEYQNENHTLNKLVCDSANNIWVASDTFLIKFDSKSKSTYTLSDFGCPSNYIRSIQSDRIGNLWIMSDLKLIKVSDNNHQVYVPDYSIMTEIFPGIRNICFDQSNNVWIAVWGFGLLKFDGTNWTYFTRYNSGLEDSQFYSIAMDKLGNIWLGLQWGDVYGYRKGGVLLNVSENSLNNFRDFSLSPNPASDFIEISFSQNDIDRRVNPTVDGIAIYNVFGEKIINLTPTLSIHGEGVTTRSYYSATPPESGGDKIRIDVSGLLTGIYFVKVGEKIGKFVKI